MMQYTCLQHAEVHLPACPLLYFYLLQYNCLPALLIQPQLQENAAANGDAGKQGKHKPPAGTDRVCALAVCLSVRVCACTCMRGSMCVNMGRGIEPGTGLDASLWVCQNACMRVCASVSCADVLQGRQAQVQQAVATAQLKANSPGGPQRPSRGAQVRFTGFLCWLCLPWFACFAGFPDQKVF